MVKLIIVDDEDMTREGLIDFIEWDRLGVEIAGEASDGVEALELMESVKPDILLCDVRMPRMDGIALSNRAREMFPDCKIIFLSGYSDVEYLKSAIKINAVDYIEKPVDFEELEALISNTVNLCVREREKKRAEQEMRLKIERSIPYVKSRIVEMLTGSEELDTEAVMENIKFTGLEFCRNNSFICCVLSAQDRTDKEKLFELVGEVACKYEQVYISAYVNREIVLLFSRQGTLESDNIYRCCGEIIRAVNGLLKISAAAAIGSIAAGLEGIRDSYKNALEAMKYIFYYGHNTVIRYDDVVRASSSAGAFDRNRIEMLEELLKKENFEGAVRTVESIVLDIRQNLYPEIDRVRNHLFNIYLLITKIYMENIFKIENDNDTLWAKVFMAGELSTIRNFLINKLTAVRDRVMLEKSSRVKSVIKEIEEYIEQNYNKQISINSISNAICLAPTYLCLLYKKERGETINEYITRLRIDKAKELLKDRKVKLYEVAYKVGYNDSNYFARVFKKLTGYNPSEYR